MRKSRTNSRPKAQRVANRRKQDVIHERSQRGGQPNELGALEGQNAEQGNTADRRYAVNLGKPAH